MDKVLWCIRQREGIKLVEPSQNLAQAYMKKAEDSLFSIRLNTVRDWKISTAYYAMYFSLYGIMMRLGVKCEIHSCTIEFASQFLKEYFSDEEVNFLEDSLKSRIDAQYYVNRNVPDQQVELMIKKAPDFHVKCKGILMKLNERKVEEIRGKLRSLIV